MEFNMELPRREFDHAALLSYVYRLSEKLSVVLSSIDSGNFTPEAKRMIENGSVGKVDLENLKQSIIKTASLIKSVEEKLKLEMKSEYAAVSDIGTYTAEAIANYEVSGRGIGEYFTLMENVAGSVERLSGYVKSGIMASGEIGIEIGSFGTDGRTPFKVRLTDKKLSFLDGAGEVAYLSDSTLHITKAEIGGKAIFGDYEVDFTNGVIWRWNG